MAGKSVDSVDNLVDDLIGQKGIGRAGFYHAEQKKQMQQHIKENITPLLQKYYYHSPLLAEEITEQACWYMWKEGYEPGSGSHLQMDPFRSLRRLADFYGTHSLDICSFDRLDAVALVRKVRPALEAWMSRPGATPRKDPWPELTVLVEKLSAVASTAPGNPDVLCFLADNVIHLKEKAMPHRSPFTWKAADKFFNAYHKWFELLRTEQSAVGTGLTKEAAILYDLPIPRLEKELTAGKKNARRFDGRNVYYSTRTPEGIEILTRVIELCLQYHKKMIGLPFSSHEIVDGASKFRSGQIPDLKYYLNGLERFLEVISLKQCQTIEEVVKCASLEVPNYNVVSVMKGGLGNVFLVQHQRQKGITYAVKIFGHRESMADSPARAKELLSAFSKEELTRQEADLNARLREGHKHVVRYIEEITVKYHGEKLPAIKMEYVPGVNLKEEIETGRALPDSKTIRYLEQIIKGLDFLHAHGLKCMGDLKPDNIVIAGSDKEDKKIMLIDFGLAWTEEKEALIPGSRFYTAPEAFVNSKAVSRVSDWWGVGMLAYYALTGETLLHEKEGQDIPQQLREMYTQRELPEEYQKRIKEKVITAFFRKFILAALQPAVEQREKEVANYIESVRTFSRWPAEVTETAKRKITALRKRSLDHLVREQEGSLVDVPLLSFREGKRGEDEPYPITVEEILKSQEPVLIFGHGGQGKTMLATEIAQTLLKEQTMPLLVGAEELNSLLRPHEPTTPEKVISLVWSGLAQKNPDPDLRSLFKAAYLLDDYHKINPDYQNLVKDAVQQLAAAGSNVLLFSRLERADLQPPKNPGYVTVQIDSRSFGNSLDQFVRKRVPGERQEEFGKYLTQYDESISGNFITLHVLTMLFSQPENIAKLYPSDWSLMKTVHRRERLTATQLYEVQTDFVIGSELSRVHPGWSWEKIGEEIRNHKDYLAELAWNATVG